jgi:hypothetical protein
MLTLVYRPLCRPWSALGGAVPLGPASGAQETRATCPRAARCQELDPGRSSRGMWVRPLLRERAGSWPAESHLFETREARQESWNATPDAARSRPIRSLTMVNDSPYTPHERNALPSNSSSMKEDCPWAFFWHSSSVNGVGIHAFTNIVLPLFWAWPKARRLGREGLLSKPIPAATFLVAPLMWTVLVSGPLLLAAVVLPSVAGAYLAGLLVSLGQTVSSLLKPNAKLRQDMQADFADTWRAYLKASHQNQNPIATSILMGGMTPEARKAAAEHYRRTGQRPTQSVQSRTEEAAERGAIETAPAKTAVGSFLAGVHSSMTRQDLEIAAWGGKELLRLELLMDYTEPAVADSPDVLGVAAVRWLFSPTCSLTTCPCANSKPSSSAIFTQGSLPF